MSSARDVDFLKKVRLGTSLKTKFKIKIKF